MMPEVGTTLYLYTIRTGKFNVYKGKVIENKYGISAYRKVAFETRTNKEWCPNKSEIGVILTGGPRLWLTERDDVKAKKLFVKHEKAKLAELKEKVDKKKALIKMLESVGMEE